MADKLTQQLIRCIQDGMREITADDVTDCGRIALDPAHSPNGKQSGIGSFFNRMMYDGYLLRTDQVTRSKAPKRKGGAIRIWQVTKKGVAWAMAQKN